MEKKFYHIIVNKVKNKVNQDRYTRNLEPLVGEQLRCIAHRDVGVILDIVADNDPGRRSILEKIFLRYIPGITEIIVDRERDKESIKTIKSKFKEEIDILEEFLCEMDEKKNFKTTIIAMAEKLGEQD